MDTSQRKTSEQNRAWFAYQCAEKGAKLSKAAEYKAYTKKFPTLVKTNGLGAALAFIYAKSSPKPDSAGHAYQLIYQQIHAWLKTDQKDLLKLQEKDELVAKVIESDSSIYRAVTIEVRAFMNWVRRFAEGMIEKEVDDA